MHFLIGMGIGVAIVLLTFLVYARMSSVIGRTMTHATTADLFWKNSMKGDTSTMKPKDLLVHLESGDHSLEDLKTGFFDHGSLNEFRNALANADFRLMSTPLAGGLVEGSSFAAMGERAQSLSNRQSLQGYAVPGNTFQAVNSTTHLGITQEPYR